MNPLGLNIEQIITLSYLSFVRRSTKLVVKLTLAPSLLKLVNRTKSLFNVGPSAIKALRKVRGALTKDPTIYKSCAIMGSFLICF